MTRTVFLLCLRSDYAAQAAALRERFADAIPPVFADCTTLQLEEHQYAVLPLPPGSLELREAIWLAARLGVRITLLEHVVYTPEELEQVEFYACRLPELPVQHRLVSDPFHGFAFAHFPALPPEALPPLLTAAGELLVAEDFRAAACEAGLVGLRCLLCDEDGFWRAEIPHVLPPVAPSTRFTRPIAVDGKRCFLHIRSDLQYPRAALAGCPDFAVTRECLGNRYTTPMPAVIVSARAMPLLRERFPALMLEPVALLDEEGNA